MSETRQPGFCALCRSRCGQIVVVRDGRLAAVEPDPGHPTGAALCVKGKAAPEIVANPNRLLYPLRRTAPKGAADPGWRRIGWDEALDEIAARLRHLAREHGPEALAWAVASPSATPVSDNLAWIERFFARFGTPNMCNATELCNWHKDFAHRYTFGRGIATPDFARADAILLWGHNPSVSWLDHATQVAAAKARGAALVVVDPRRAGFAARADAWLRVRPGTDAALALGLIRAVIERGGYDADFVRRWTDAPLLVRDDTGRYLRAAEIAPGAAGHLLVAWDERGGRPVVYDPARASMADDASVPALAAPPVVAGIGVSTVFDRLRRRAADCTPPRVERETGVSPALLERAAALLARRRPVAYYCWTGVGQHRNATQTDRAIAILMALTGSFDAPGGNVDFGRPPTIPVDGQEFLTPERRARMIGAERRPNGPVRFGLGVTAADLYDAILDRRPYAVRALMSFGGNPLATRADPARGRRALAALDFHVHADVVPNATAAFADILLPVNTPWEREGLRVGFEGGEAAASLVQLRKAAVAPAGESRSDAEIVFALAKRLGFGADFWDGDVEAAMAAAVAPAGLTLAELRARPEGISVRRTFAYRRHAARAGDGFRGVDTATRLVELYSEPLLEGGHDPLPHGAPAPAEAGPFLVTTAKVVQFCHSQHRDIPALRRRRPEPVVSLHPEAAASRGIADGDWVELVNRRGRARMKAHLDAALAPDVAVADYGWADANPNALVDSRDADPISGSVTHRGFAADIVKAAPPAGD
jgi:anaerobic selenocysteine-containing dehydrogenase